MRKECAMTQTSPTIESITLSSYKNTSASTSDDPDLLEVLSQCEGTNDEYDFNEDECDDEKPNRDGLNELSANATHEDALREAGLDIVTLRNGDFIALQNDYSDRSLSSLKTVKSEWDSCRSSNGSILQTPLRRPFGLQLAHEPFHNIMELPSPSSASLYSGHGNPLMPELTSKSNSAPVLLKKERKRDDFIVQPIVSIAMQKHVYNS